ncbi:hypothetical protein MKX01_016663 [Papaver californicum]|nr:hypothetical protein MKX01_016663 [Papaver californicum]
MANSCCRESILSVELKNVSDGSFSSEESLKELGQLVDTAGLTVVGSTFQKLATPNPMTYIGSGKVAEIKTAINALDAEIVIFDDELQQGNIRSLQGQPHGGASSLHCDAWISLCIFALDRSSRSCIVVTSEHDQYHLGVKVPEKKLTVSFWLHLQLLQIPTWIIWWIIQIRRLKVQW